MREQHIVLREMNGDGHEAFITLKESPFVFLRKRRESEDLPSPRKTFVRLFTSE